MRFDLILNASFVHAFFLYSTGCQAGAAATMIMIMGAAAAAAAAEAVAAASRLSVVELLIGASASLDVTDRWGHTPLEVHANLLAVSCSCSCAYF